MDTLNVLKELAEGHDLKAAVSIEALDSGYEYPEDFFKDLLQNGCQS